ncbi:MAG TPA: hypothetical protein VGN16_19460 [Acidobacteriaceae bacterium]|jgi:hypothetical protein
MQTTLTIDDDVFMAAESIAIQRNQTIGQVISDLLRHALRTAHSPFTVVDGIPILVVQDNTTTTAEDIKAVPVMV